MTDIDASEKAIHAVQYGSQQIPFVWHKRNRLNARRKARIHVHPDGMVEVQTPHETSLSEAKQALLKRARWVSQHLQAISARRSEVLERQYVSGETVFYRGRRYTLKIFPLESPGQTEHVKLVRGQVRVTTARPAEPAVIKKNLLRWYRARALDVFADRLVSVSDRLPWVSSPPDWSLRVMRSQWGSCSPRGQILLNPHLIKAPTRCIDYVILHELSHLREHNHGPNFYALLDQAMPDWQDIKRQLDGMAEMYLNE